MEFSAKLDEKLEDEAAEWHALMHSGDVDPELRKRFESWLAADHNHRRAYAGFEQVYRDLDYALVAAEVDVDAVLGRSEDIEAPDTSSPPAQTHAGAKWKAWLGGFIPRPALIGGGMAAAAAAALALFLTFPVLDAPQSPAYSTQIAEITEIRLEDGSVITLGAQSKIETAFTDTSRQVTLVSGEAFFDVAKDENRPFFVIADDTLVRVVGTQFDVKHSGETIHIAVLEGVVEVTKPQDIQEILVTADTSGLAKQVLTAGQKVEAFRLAALPIVQQVERAPPGVWRTGRLAYEDASLAEIVTDLGRYREQPIRLASSDIGALRSTVAFEVDDIDQFLEVIETIHPVEIEKSSSGAIIIRPKR
ncbi:FecR family protein [Erythrobacter aureus]|uniref:FecR family protein n=1 Tax=Erythrobacter aureus TaxID=2182384 RepID=UPI003A92FF43